MFRWMCCGLLLLFAAPRLSAAPPTDVAELFPTDTLAFVEVHNPRELAPQLAALLKGTPLEDSIPLIDEKLNQTKTYSEYLNKRHVAMLALFCSPEMIGEFKKLDGAAVALLGFNESGAPEVALAVLTGESTAAGIAARAYLTTRQNVRKVSEVLKVPIFQDWVPIIRYDDNGTPLIENEKPPAESPYAMTYAYTPGLIVIGTSKAAVAPVIKRFRGEEKPSLKETAAFKAAAAEHRKPGVYFYANAPDLVAKVNEAGRKRGEPIESDLLSWLSILTNQKSVKWIAGSMLLRDGGLALTCAARLDPSVSSPLADLLAGPAVKIDALHHARKPTAFAATMNLPEKNRGAVLLRFLDSVAKANGELGRLPSDLAKELEDEHKVALRDSLLAKLKSITVIVPSQVELSKEAKVLPIIVLHMDDAATAAAMESALPRIIAAIAGEKPVQPSSETVNGVKIHSLPSTGLPWKTPLHFVRKDHVIVIGQERKRVAAAFAPDSAGSMVGGEKPLVPPAGDVVLMGAVNIGELIGTFDLPFMGINHELDQPPFIRRNPAEPELSEEASKEVKKARAAFLASFSQLPPATLSVRRNGEDLRLELFQPKLANGGLTPIITAGVNWFDKLMSFGQEGNPFLFEPRPFRR